MIFIIFNLLRSVLWPRMWSVLRTASHELDKKCSILLKLNEVGYRIHYIQLIHGGVSSIMSLLTFSLLKPFSARGVLSSPTMTVNSVAIVELVVHKTLVMS